MTKNKAKFFLVAVCSVVLVAVLLFGGLLLSGCGKKNDDEKPNPKSITQIIADATYKVDSLKENIMNQKQPENQEEVGATAAAETPAAFGVETLTWTKDDVLEQIPGFFMFQHTIDFLNRNNVREGKGELKEGVVYKSEMTGEGNVKLPFYARYAKASSQVQFEIYCDFTAANYMDYDQYICLTLSLDKKQNVVGLTMSQCYMGLGTDSTDFNEFYSCNFNFAAGNAAFFSLTTLRPQTETKAQEVAGGAEETGSAEGGETQEEIKFVKEYNAGTLTFDKLLDEYDFDNATIGLINLNNIFEGNEIYSISKEYAVSTGTLGKAITLYNNEVYARLLTNKLITVPVDFAEVVTTELKYLDEAMAYAQNKIQYLIYTKNEVTYINYFMGYSEGLSVLGQMKEALSQLSYSKTSDLYLMVKTVEAKMTALGSDMWTGDLRFVVEKDGKETAYEFFIGEDEHLERNCHYKVRMEKPEGTTGDIYFTVCLELGSNPKFPTPGHSAEYIA